MKVAEQFGVPHFILVKICKSHKIPRPPVGYWSKLRHGKTVPRTPLPANEDGALENIVFPHWKRSLNWPQSPTVISPTHLAHNLVVLDQLTSPHPLIATTKQLIKLKPPDEKGILHGARDNMLDINVSRKALDRALRIMDAMIKYWEGRDGTVHVRKYGDAGSTQTVFRMETDEIAITLSEKLESGPKKRVKNWYGGYDLKPTRYPKGKLCFEVHGGYQDGRRTWGDGERQRLEEILGAVVQAVRDSIERTRRSRLHDECRERQQHHAAERRAWQARAQKAEKNRRRSLIKLLKRRNTANQIRELVACAKSENRRNGAAMLAELRDGTWQSWALWYADRLDPLVSEGECPIADGPGAPVNTPLEKLDLTEEIRRILLAIGVPDSDAMARLRKVDVDKACGGSSWCEWEEICQVLEGMGYEVPEDSDG